MTLAINKLSHYKISIIDHGNAVLSVRHCLGQKNFITKHGFLLGAPTHKKLKTKRLGNTMLQTIITVRIMEVIFKQRTISF